jgi:hypothetical protein
MKYIFPFILIILTNASLSQSKKEQIERLTLRKDSIQGLLDKERESHTSSKSSFANQTAELNNQINELNAKSENQNARIANLESQLKKLETQLQIKEQEIFTQKNTIGRLKKQNDSIHNELNQQLNFFNQRNDSLKKVIVSLKKEIQEKSDSLYLRNNKDFEFIILNYTDSEDTPLSILGYGNLANNDFYILDADCYNYVEMVTKDEYGYLNIPNNAKFACGINPVGTGDIYYSIEVENVIKIFKGIQGEGPDEYQEVINYKLYKEIEKL